MFVNYYNSGVFASLCFVYDNIVSLLVEVDISTSTLDNYMQHWDPQQTIAYFHYKLPSNYPIQFVNESWWAEATRAQRRNAERHIEKGRKKILLSVSPQSGTAMSFKNLHDEKVYPGDSYWLICYWQCNKSNEKKKKRERKGEDRRGLGNGERANPAVSTTVGGRSFG